MERSALLALAQQLLAGQISPEQFADRTGGAAAPPAPSAQLANATLDLDRRRRCGYPEVVFGQGKSAESLAQILATLSAREEDVLATRITPEIAAQLLESLPSAIYNPVARTLRLRRSPAAAHDPARRPWVAVITAGTSDLPVAEEARETLDWMGVRVTMIHDVGVAGPHRLPSRLAEFEEADAVVVVAGMEGALPSVVGGFVACPVIAVPTSVGYGASFGGVAALLSMLNSCASNVAVVNIDAGFKAAYLAGMIASRRHPASSAPAASPAE